VPKLWKISFSYGRALQDLALEAWHGRDENLAAGRRPFPTGPAPTARRVWGCIRMRWKRHRAMPMIHRIAETGATTDTTDRRQRNGRLDDTEFRGGDDGKRAG
jgi:hypothetical protein